MLDLLPSSCSFVVPSRVEIPPKRCYVMAFFRHEFFQYFNIMGVSVSACLCVLFRVLIPHLEPLTARACVFFFAC